MKQMLHQFELCKHYSWFTNGFHIHNSQLQTGRKAITLLNPILFSTCSPSLTSLVMIGGH